MSRDVGAIVVLAGVLLAAAACSGERTASSSADATSVALTGDHARSAAAAPLLGMSFGRVYRVDPRSLEPLPGRRARVDGHTFGWSFSPDRSMLVLGSQVVAEVRFIDLERMRMIGDDDLRLKRPGIVAATAWPAPRRVLAVVQSPGCCIGEATLFVVDPLTQRIIRRQPLRGSLQAFARFGGGLVLLLSPPRSLGPARLVVVDRRGTARSVVLAEIVAGQEPVQLGNRPGRESRPGLGLDSAGGRAFVVAAEAPVAEVKLASMRVRYRPLSRPVSLLGRLRDWLEPVARADVPPTGPVRKARWLGGLLAVAGYDSYYAGGRYRTRPSGLKLVDLRSGLVRTLDTLADGFTVTAGTILPASRRPGLAAYSLDGSLRLQLFQKRFPGKPAFVAVTLGTRAFVTIAGHWPRAFVVELSSGRVLGERTLPRAQLISPSQEPGWP